MSILKNIAAISIPEIPKVTVGEDQVAQAVNAVLIVTGAVATLFIIIGAIRYVISNGDQKAVIDARNTILYAVIGLVISMSAFVIVQFVLGRLFT